MSRRATTYTTRYVRDRRYYCDIVDTTGLAPRVIAGYSYPIPAAHGQVDDLARFPRSERSLCLIRNHRSNTTVNGVCLDCLMATRKRVAA